MKFECKETKLIEASKCLNGLMVRSTSGIFIVSEGEFICLHSNNPSRVTGNRASTVDGAFFTCKLVEV